MKFRQFILSIAIIAMMYSCGGSSDNNQSDKTAEKETQEKSELVVKKKPENKLKQILDTIKQKDIYIIKYKGTLGKSKITLQLRVKDSNDLDTVYSLYMYDKLNNPLLLASNSKSSYLCLHELFPKKKGKRYPYKKGGTLSFKNHKTYNFEMKGEYTNPKGTKNYPVSLQATEIVTKNQKENFEELQEYSASKHYFTVKSSWSYDSSMNEYQLFVHKINVYDKQTNKKLQILNIPFEDYLYATDVEPTNTKPNGIQIGYYDGNDNGDLDYAAFLLKNGKYEKDSMVCAEYKYSRYDENGDIITEIFNVNKGYYCRKIVVTSKLPYKEKIIEDDFVSEPKVKKIY